MTFTKENAPLFIPLLQALAEDKLEGCGNSDPKVWLPLGSTDFMYPPDRYRRRRDARVYYDCGGYTFNTLEAAAKSVAHTVHHCAIYKCVEMIDL